MVAIHWEATAGVPVNVVAAAPHKNWFKALTVTPLQAPPV